MKSSIGQLKLKNINFDGGLVRHRAKRLMDVIVSLVLIVILSPVLITIYAIISVDGGRGVYMHYRMGRNNKGFNCLKFRSMAVNSKELLDELLENDSAARKEWNESFKLKNDPRVTKIGKFLRATSLDELPQLFNVLIGEMSLVGPRPVVEKELSYYSSVARDKYFSVRPGMTGLWQVSGRSDVDYAQRVALDVYYVDNLHLRTDLVLLMKTVGVVFLKKGAY